MKPFVDTAKPKTTAKYLSRLTNKYANSKKNLLFFLKITISTKQKTILRKSSPFKKNDGN